MLGVIGVEGSSSIVFNDKGNIVVTWSNGEAYEIERGIVLLTLAQAVEASKYGWSAFSERTPEERRAGLVRVSRKSFF